MNAMTSKLPEWARKSLRGVKSVLKDAYYTGNARYCPTCGRSSRCFNAFGYAQRKDAQCAFCGSLERHRLLWLFIQRKTDLFDGKPKKMLHVAPEQVLSSRIATQLGDSYLSADLCDPSAMVKMDVTDIQYPDQSFDVIFCNHVLEHIPDDRQAMRELCRVLKSEGWAILLVPITADETFEDPSITDPAERLAIYGHEDHVRNYGPDYADRLREAGFHVEVVRVGDLADPAEATKMALTPASGEIFYCTK